MKMNKTWFYQVKTGFISSKTGFWLFRFFSFRFFFFDQPSKNLTLWQEFRVGPGSGMPRSEVYDAKTRKGSLKNSGSSIYFTFRRRKNRGRNRCQKEECSCFATSTKTSERSVFTVTKTILLYQGYYQLIRGGGSTIHRHTNTLGFMKRRSLEKIKDSNAFNPKRNSKDVGAS